MKSVWKKTTGLAIATAFLLALALQYPLSTTFPIGGDATRYIMRAQAVLEPLPESPLTSGKTLLTNSNYPGTIALVAASAALPLSWPDRFVWLMTIGHIATGLAIGLLLYRTAGWQAAAIGIAVWGLTATRGNHHYEDGTLAQLLSLPFLLLASNSFLFQPPSRQIKTVFWGIAVFLIHSFSGLVLLLTLGIATPALLYNRYRTTQDPRSLLVSSSAFIGVVSVGLLIGRYVTGFPTNLPSDTQMVYFADTLHSFLGPAIIMAPLGLLYLVKQTTSKPRTAYFFTTFALVSILLTFNPAFGIGLFATRFETYYTLTISIGAAIGFWITTQSVFPIAWMRGLFFSLLFFTLGIAAWNHAIPIYEFYESGSRYARLHSHEQAAIHWLKENASPDSTILTSKANRHSEWIPILSHLNWEGLPASHPLFTNTTDALQDLTRTTHATHLVFFTHREGVPAHLQEHPRLKIVFQNEGAVVLEIQPL